MPKLIISSNPGFTTEVTVQESDQYSGLAYVRLEKNFRPEHVHATSELFLTSGELSLLGKFLIKQAEELRVAQVDRNL